MNNIICYKIYSMWLDPNTPLINTIYCYIIIIGMILVSKPNIIYCKNTKKFKSFGLENNKTLFPFPVICISTGVLLYLFFIIINSIYNLL